MSVAVIMRVNVTGEMWTITRLWLPSAGLQDECHRSREESWVCLPRQWIISSVDSHKKTKESTSIDCSVQQVC